MLQIVLLSIAQLLSIAIIVIGILPLTYADNNVTIQGDSVSTQSAAIVLICFGGLSLIISFAGCCGALRQSTCLLYTHVTLLAIVVFVNFILGGILAAAMGSVPLLLREAFHVLWDDRLANMQFWTVVQTEFRCCGVTGPLDWPAEAGLPASCCPTNYAPCPIDSAWTTGCADATSDTIVWFGYLLAGVAFVTGAVQMIGFVFACVLVNRVRRDRRGQGLVLGAAPVAGASQYVYNQQPQQQPDQAWQQQQRNPYQNVQAKIAQQ